LQGREKQQQRIGKTETRSRRRSEPRPLLCRGPEADSPGQGTEEAEEQADL